MKKPTCWVVDIDGTLALRGDRDPYDWSLAGRDLPNMPVVTVVRALAEQCGVSAIVVVSGRQELARPLTTEWLRRHDIPFSKLLMRQDGDYRSDDIVKEEIFSRLIEPHYSVGGVIDDRERVVKMWRRLGLVCFQVADGIF